MQSLDPLCTCGPITLNSLPFGGFGHWLRLAHPESHSFTVTMTLHSTAGARSITSLNYLHRWLHWCGVSSLL